MELLTSHNVFGRLYRFLGGTGLALALFGAITLFVIPGTFGIGRSLYTSPPFKVLLALLTVNLLACTAQRWKRLKWPVLLLHAGVLITLAGAFMRHDDVLEGKEIPCQHSPRGATIWLWRILEGRVRMGCRSGAVRTCLDPDQHP